MCSSYVSSASAALSNFASAGAQSRVSTSAVPSSIYSSTSPRVSFFAGSGSVFSFFFGAMVLSGSTTALYPPLASRGLQRCPLCPGCSPRDKGCPKARSSRERRLDRLDASIELRLRPLDVQWAVCGTTALCGFMELR